MTHISKPRPVTVTLSWFPVAMLPVVWAISGPAAAVDPPPIGNPAGMAPDTPGVFAARPAAEHPNTADLIFSHEAALGGMAEVNAGKLAARKGQSAAVKEFANRMVSDHTAAGERLTAVNKSNKVQAPPDLDKDHKVTLDQLGKADGKAFDVAYIRAQIVDHQKTAQLYEWIIDNGQDPRLVSYAMETLPSVLRHLEMAKSLQAQLTGSAP
jgi:putative membrane protein